jgi:hypothetical protein
MTISLTHNFQSPKADGTDTSLVQPSNWNDQHQLALSSGKLIGRTSTGAGAAEEIAVSPDLDLSSGTLGLSSATSTKINSGNTFATTGAELIGLTSGADPRNLKFWRDGLTRQNIANPGNFARIAVLADSRASSYFGGYVYTTNALRSWPVALAKRLNRDTGLAVAYDSWWGSTRGVGGTVGDTTDSRMTNSGWSQGTTKGPGGALFNTASVGSTLSFTTSQAVDTIDVIYYGGGAGSFTVSVDGGTTPLNMSRVAWNGAGTDGAHGEVPFTSASFTATISGTVMTVSAVSSGTIAVGQRVRKVVVNPVTGTVITEYGTISTLGTGTGGTGTYNMSASNTVGSATAMIGTAPATTLSCNFGASGDNGTSYIRRRVMASGTTLGFDDTNFGASGVKTITLKSTVGGCNVLGVAAYNSANPQVQMHQLSWVGSTTASWGDGTTAPTATQWWDIMRPDLTIIDIGTNDMTNNLGQASPAAGQALATSYLNTIVGSSGVSGLRRYGDVMMVIPFDINPATVDINQQISWQNFLRSYAAGNNIAVYDMQKRFVSYSNIGLGFGTKGTTPGWYADTTHVYDPGHQDYANAIAKFINWI